MTTMPPSPMMRESSLPKGYFSTPFERFQRDDLSDWAGAFTLLDTMETYWDSRIDLIQRRLQKHGDGLKRRAQEAFKINNVSGELIPEHLERELKEFKTKISGRISTLSATWHSAKVVRTRDKVTFFFGVMSLLGTALLFGMAPQWLHVAYTLQALYLLPVRFYTYKRKMWHYFLFDLCYYVTIINFLYIWVFPGNASLFVACYALSHGSLASAVITWRNSLVFHDNDKVTSLFVHLYPPLVFSVIRHFYPNSAERFPALKQLPHLQPMRALLLSGVLYLTWQMLYWKFILINRRKKIESGQRTTSFSFLLNDKRGAIGRALASTKPEFREPYFMLGQFAYAVLTELPAVYVLYDSPLWSGIFLFSIFAVSVWNGGGFYIEVFGRKFERELEALRKELAEVSARSGRSSPTTMSMSEDELASITNSPVTHPLVVTSGVDALELEPSLTKKAS